MQGPADPWRASRRAEGATSVKGSDSRLGELQSGEPTSEATTPPEQLAPEEACPPQTEWHFWRLTVFFNPREKRNKEQVGKNHFPGCQQLLWGPPEDPSQASSSARASGSGLRGDGVHPSAHTPKPLPWTMPEQRVSNTPRRATHDSQTHLQRAFSPVSCTSFHQQDYSSSGWSLPESSPGPCPIFSTGTTSQALGKVTLIKVRTNSRVSLQDRRAPVASLGTSQGSGTASGCQRPAPGSQEVTLPGPFIGCFT